MTTEDKVVEEVKHVFKEALAGRKLNERSWDAIILIKLLKASFGEIGQEDGLFYTGPAANEMRTRLLKLRDEVRETITSHIANQNAQRMLLTAIAKALGKQLKDELREEKLRRLGRR